MRVVSLVSFAFLSREGGSAHRASNARTCALPPPKHCNFARSSSLLLPCVSSFFYRASHTIYPPPNSIFSALNLTPLSRVKGEWERGDSGRRSGEDVRLR